MKLGVRIKTLRQGKGMTQAQLGACFNLAESTISLYESGKRSPDYEILCKLAHYFQVSIDYLLGHVEERRSPETDPGWPQPYDPEGDPAQSLDGLPLVTSVYNAPNGLVYAMSAAAERQSTYKPEQTEFFWLQLANDAMSGDAILPNDFVLVRKQALLEYGEIGLAVVGDEPGAVCRVFQKEKSIVLQSSNPAYPPRIFAGKELAKVRIVGRIVEIRRKF